MGLLWCLLLLLVSAGARSLELVTHNPQNNIFCPQGLSNCRLNDTSPLRAHDADCGPVRVCSLTVEPKLCCYHENCRPCLWINIQLGFIPETEEEEDEEQSGYDDQNGGCTALTDDVTEGQREYLPCEDQLGHEGRPAAVTICYTSAGRVPTSCKRLDFIMTSATSYKPFNLILVKYEDVEFGRKMKFNVRSSSQSTEVEVPTKTTVCSSPQHKHIKECKGPRVICEIDRQRGVVKMENEGGASSLDFCMKRGKQGKCWHLPSNIVPLELITDCTCFQAWNKGSTRMEICPFEQHPEFKENVLRNVSVSVDHTTTYDGQLVLGWNLTAPCRIGAELWPCQVEADGTCREIPGFRQQCSNETHWEENVTALWASGKFVNTSQNHRHLCVMLHVDGKIPHYYCQHPLGRQYWSLLIPLALVIVCLTIFGIVLLVYKLKWWISGWERPCHCQDTRGQVLLLHSSATDHQAQLVCKLGQMLSELGFSVFLDLWNQKELSSLGPAPWFHSKLSHIQKHGGKVLLMLSPTTIQTAECFWNVSKGEKKNPHSSVTYSSSDVLGAALGCISADRQKGGAAQRFVLVQLDNHEHLISEEGDMPQLFRGLPLYKLPLQTQGLLMELCLESPNSLSGKLKKMWWMKRARRKLAQGLQSACNGKRSRTESVLTQEDSLSLNMEYMEERVYLKKGQL